jgi:hypothetical protein
MDGIMAERRKYQRYELEEKCLLRKETAVGTIIDLSLGGLSCSCCSPDSDDCSNRCCKNIDIFCTENKVWVLDLTMDIIDSEKTPGQFLDNFWIRKCRARFNNLRKEQATQLENLILTVAKR